MKKQTTSFQVVDHCVYLLEQTGRYRAGEPELQNRIYANLQGTRFVSQTELNKTAHLFAASQEMYDALDLVLGGDYQLPDELYDIIHAAIGKADGVK